MRVIINEIQIKRKNFHDKNHEKYVEVVKGGESNATKLISINADAWIKKSKSDNGYTFEEKKRFQIQHENPHVFVKTIIINGNLIKTENIDVIASDKYINLINDINSYIESLNLYYPNGLISVIQSIYQDKFNETTFNKLLSFCEQNNKDCGRFLIDIKKLFEDFRTILKKYNYDTNIEYDLHYLNWGYNKSGKLKILDW